MVASLYDFYSNVSKILRNIQGSYMISLLRVISSTALVLAVSPVFSLDFIQGHLVFEAGVYSATQGKTQYIPIQGLIGDRFNVTKSNDYNALFGLGYYIDGFQTDRLSLDYGINAFYLAPTKVFGTIDQELLFTNLAYGYEVKNSPIYAAAKAHVKTSATQLALTLDAGLGPNFLKTTNYRDWPLDEMTLPDNAFFGRSNVTLSAMAGIGLQFTPAQGHAPIECGYHFFYLGEGGFNARCNSILNTLKTGNNYAQALVCSVKA
jgi:hypothetical protein